MSQSQLIQIVNEADEPIGSATKQEAQEKGLIHRIVQVMIEDTEGRILLQKRSADREIHPDRWDTSVGGHVDEGEDYLTAAYREMLEEIGLDKVVLQELGKYRKQSQLEWRQLDRYYKAFKVVIPPETEFHLEPEEVSEVRWFDIDEIRELIKQHPDKCTGALSEAIARFYP